MIAKAEMAPSVAEVSASAMTSTVSFVVGSNMDAAQRACVGYPCVAQQSQMVQKTDEGRVCEREA